MPAGVGFTQVALARSRVGEQGTNGGLVLLRCRARTCAGRRVNLGAVDRIEVLGVVDLDGARIERPLLVNAAVVRQHGVGVVVGGALTRPIAGGLLLGAELRAYLVRWDNPPGPVSTDPMDGAAPGGVTFTPSTDVGSALPVTLTVGLRVLL